MSPIIGKMPMPRTRLRDLRLSTRGHGSVYGSPILEPLKMSHAFPVILFYKYVSVSDPASFAAEQRNLCTSIGLKGRILIAEEGINGTLAGSAESIDSYVAALKKDPRFADIEFKVSGGDAGTFPKLVVKVRPEIVALNAGEIRPDQVHVIGRARTGRRHGGGVRRSGVHVCASSNSGGAVGWVNPGRRAGGDPTSTA